MKRDWRGRARGYRRREARIRGNFVEGLVPALKSSRGCGTVSISARMRSLEISRLGVIRGVVRHIMALLALAAGQTKSSGRPLAEKPLRLRHGLGDVAECARGN